ncbi:MAG: hypothetical protein AB1478_09645 [Nitrospirota bacterium]
MKIDLLIKGGTVFDGTGAEPFEADIGIAEDRIIFVNKKSAPYPVRGCFRRNRHEPLAHKGT